MRLAFRFGPPLALMGVIFFFSAQPDLGTGLGTWDLILRKAAHMAEYGLLWFLWYRALELPSPLRCVSFHTPLLPQLQNLTRTQLIDSLPACYPETRAWAQAAYRHCPQAQAIAYGSRRDDSGRCIMLFGQRLPTPRFEIVKVESLALPPRRAEVLALIRRLKIHEV